MILTTCTHKLIHKITTYNSAIDFITELFQQSIQKTIYVCVLELDDLIKCDMVRVHASHFKISIQLDPTVGF